MADFKDFEIEMTRKDTRRFRFQVKLNGVVQNTSSWLGFWFTAKYSVGDTDLQAVMQLTLGSGIEVVDATVGLYEVTISPANTASLANSFKRLFSDIQGKDGTSAIWTVAKGMLFVKPEVTQAS